MHSNEESWPNSSPMVCRIRTQSNKPVAARRLTLRQRGKVDSVRMRYDAVIFHLFGTLTPTVTPADYEAILQ